MDSDAKPDRYQIRIRGVLSERLLRAFPGLEAHTCGGETVLAGALPDQAALHGVLDRIEALGLKLLEVRSGAPSSRDPSQARCPSPPTRYASKEKDMEAVINARDPGKSGAPPDPRRWLILVVIAIAQLMIVLDATIMNIALPSAQRALQFSVADRQWVVTAYALAFGSLLLLGGKLADLLGRKAMFLTGMAGFAAASAAGGAAVSFPMLISARAAQGAFAALLAPAALSLLATTFIDPAERRQSFAVYGAVAGSGGAVGLVLGGLLTQYLSWRWCLYVNVLFAAAAGIGAAVLLGRDVPGRRPRLDLLGAALVSGGMFCIVYGFANAASHTWGTPSTWAFIAAGLVLLAAFVLWQARAPEPLLPLRIVADRNRAGAYLATLLAGAGMFGLLLFLNYYMQQILGYSPVITGLAFLPMVALVMVAGQLASVALMPRTGPRPLIAAGMLLGGASATLLTRLGPHSGYAGYILPSVLLLGAGLGFIFAPSADTGTAGVPFQDSGVASATLNTGNQLGGSVGTSLLNSIFASAIAAWIAANLRGRPSPHQLSLAALHGYTVAFWWTAGIFAAGAVVCGTLMRWGPLARPAQPASATWNTQTAGTPRG
jgi:EmrB/QacA subfamily drug resistance transporter